MFLVTVDCGNTRAHVAIFDLDRVPPLPTDDRAWAGAEGAEVAAFAVKNPMAPAAIEAEWQRVTSASGPMPDVAAVVVGSVNPRATEAIESWATEFLPATPLIRLATDMPIPIPNLTEKPWQVGQDRLLNTLACRYRFPGQGAVVIDFGTAITFDICSPAGEYLGGVIAPGIHMTLAALHQNTALLPLVRPRAKPPIIGKDTESAILAGVYYGVPGLVLGILDAIVNTYERRPLIVGTGGDAANIHAELTPDTLDTVLPLLTHEGILLSWQLGSAAPTP